MRPLGLGVWDQVPRAQVHVQQSLSKGRIGVFDLHLDSLEVRDFRRVEATFPAAIPCRLPGPLRSWCWLNSDILDYGVELEPDLIWSSFVIRASLPVEVASK